RPAEAIQTPTDLFDAAGRIRDGLDLLARHPTTYLFQRARSTIVGGPDEETRIVRRFETAGARPYAVSGTVRLDGSASDAELDAVLLPPGAVSVTASSRLLGNPNVRGSAALDGDPETEWLAGSDRPQTLSIRFPTHNVDHLVVHTDVL